MISVAVPVSILEILGGLSVDVQVARGVPVKAADDVQQSCLAAARLSEYGYELVLTEINADTAERLYGTVADYIVLGYVIQT